LINNLQGIFAELCSHYSNDNDKINDLWIEIKRHYESSNRYYHSLEHISNLYIELASIRHYLKEWNAILFALFYHDIIYNTLKKDNE
jgi:predicted metal-dependent HD superfamily phosphohydrolase